VDIKVFVLPGGNVQIFVDGPVSFEQAQRITEAVIAQLQATGITFTAIGAVEQHKDGVSHVHIHEGVHVSH
jgi:CRISPR/Cas system type I-B associated protein Csh2 (Cas7 group RAMP superfamily)